MASLQSSATISADINFYQEARGAYANTFLNLQGSLGYSMGVSGGSGEGPSQIDCIYSIASYTIPSGDTRQYDFKNLSGEGLASVYAISLTGLKGLVIRNHNTGQNEILLLEATGANAFTHLISGNVIIEPGGLYMYSNPLYGAAVTDTNKNLYITNIGSGAAFGAHGVPPGYNSGINISIIAVGVSGTGYDPG